jgi:hypothetical protein
MAGDPAPAIRTAYDERYSDIERIETIGSDTRFHRGFGETGTRVELVDMSESVHNGCPRCGESEMVLSLDLNPEGYDDAAFYCTNLKCPHFVQDAVEFDMNKIRADHPEEWDNTAICPDCEKRFTTTLKKGIHTTHEYVKGDAASGGIVGDVACDDCTPSLDESQRSSQANRGIGDSGAEEPKRLSNQETKEEL